MKLVTWDGGFGIGGDGGMGNGGVVTFIEDSGAVTFGV